MIPKRVLLHHPPTTKDASPAIAKKCPKGPQTDWDSPSSYTGTVKRRPPSLEATKILLSPINIDCDDDSSNSAVAVDCSSDPATTTTTTYTCTSVGVTTCHKDVEDSLSAPQEIVHGNCFRNEKNQAGITTNTRQESCSSKNKTSESQPISGASTLQRKSKLKPPTSTTSQLVSKSSSAWQPLATASSKTNLPKLSQIKKTQQFVGGKTKATATVANNPQLVKLKTAATSSASFISTSGKIKSVTALHTKLDASQLNTNKSKLGVGKLRYSNPLVSSTNNSTFIELYRDYPVDFASTTIVESIPLQPPPYCNPPSPPLHSQLKQKNDESEDTTSVTQKKIRLLQKNDDKLLQSDELAPDGVCDASTPLTTNKLANEIHRFKGNFSLQKFPSISKLSTRSYRFLSSPATIKSSSDFALNKNAIEEDDKFSFKRINRVRSNDYVLFNPTRLNNGGSPVKMAAAAEKSPTYDHLAKPEFTSSLFKNIPVRPRKGIPHLENYCLFDPNTDFVNEKELQLQQKHIRDDEFAGLQLPNSEIDDDELIEEIIYEDQILYDTLDVEDEPAPFGFITKIDEVTESSSSSQLTSSGSDAMQSSVIETSSPNVDSSPLKCPPTLPSLAIVEIIQKCDRLFRHSSLPIPTTPTTPTTRNITFTDDSSRLNELPDTLSSDEQHTNQVNFEASGVTSLTPPSLQEQQSLKQSVSSPQLQHAAKVRNKSLPLGESNYVLFHPAPVHSRTQYKIRQPRPISTHSDADSGFLSPVTPDGPSAAAAEPKFNPAILVLQQCDSIQGYIEVIEYRFFL